MTKTARTGKINWPDTSTNLTIFTTTAGEKNLVYYEHLRLLLIKKGK